MSVRAHSRTPSCRFPSSTSRSVHRAPRRDPRRHRELLETGAFMNGPQVRGVRGGVRRRTAAPRTCVGVASGLDALRLALLAAGLEPGDEVIVPGEHVRRDARGRHAGRRRAGRSSTSGEDDYNLDPDAVEAAVTARTRFVDARAPLRPDGRHARSARSPSGTACRSSRTPARRTAPSATASRAGDGGPRAAFSFYPARTSARWATPARSSRTTTTLAARVRALREHGQRRKYQHEREGYTARLDTIQARRALAQAAAPRRVERRAARGRAARYTRGARRRRRSRAAGRCRRQRAGLAPLRRPDRGRRSARRAPRASAASATGRHYPRAAAPHRGVRAARATARGRVPGRRGARRASALAADLPGDHARPQLERVVDGGRGRSSTVADAPGQRRAVPAASPTSSSARTSSSSPFTNLYGCRIGDATRIGPFVEIQRGASVGARCKIQSHTFVCDGRRRSRTRCSSGTA